MYPLLLRPEGLPVSGRGTINCVLYSSDDVPNVEYFCGALFDTKPMISLPPPRGVITYCTFELKGVEI